MVAKSNDRASSSGGGHNSEDHNTEGDHNDHHLEFTMNYPPSNMETLLIKSGVIEDTQVQITSITQ